MSLNTLQTTSEMIQPSKVYHKLKKKIETNTVNQWQREQKPTKMTLILSHATSSSTFFFMLVTSPRNNVQISHQARHVFWVLSKSLSSLFVVNNISKTQYFSLYKYSYLLFYSFDSSPSTSVFPWFRSSNHAFLG